MTTTATTATPGHPGGATTATSANELVELLGELAQRRRSGVLDVHDAELAVEFVLVAGRLVRARLLDDGETLGSVLVRAGALKAHEVEGPPGETLEGLVARVETYRLEEHLLVRVDDAIAEQLVELVLRVLRHGRGTAVFRETPAGVPPRSADDAALTLPSGIDTEELVAEARRRGLRFALTSPGWHPRFTPPSYRRPPALIVVDDDPAFLTVVAGTLGRASVVSTLLSSTRQAIEKLSALGPSDVVLVALVMPRSDGRGILGGLEVLRAAHMRGVAARVFLVLEGPHADVEKIAQELGAPPPLRRPRSDDGAALNGFLRPVLARVAPLNAEVDGSVDLARELADEIVELDELDDPEWRFPSARGALDHAEEPSGRATLATLKTLLAELNTPSFDEAIPLLILRFASLYFSRGALFRIDGERNEFVGVGGFGIGGKDQGRLVRSIHVPLHAPSVLTEAIDARCGVRRAYTDDAWDTHLATRLGAAPGTDVYVAPLVSPRGVEGVLVADNGGHDLRDPALPLLEIFLQQAGAAIERATLVRQVQWLQSLPPTTSWTTTESGEADDGTGAPVPSGMPDDDPTGMPSADR